MCGVVLFQIGDTVDDHQQIIIQNDLYKIIQVFTDPIEFSLLFNNNNNDFSKTHLLQRMMAIGAHT